MGVVVVVILLTFYSPAVCVTDVTEIVRIKKKQQLTTSMSCLLYFVLYTHITMTCKLRTLWVKAATH